MQVWSFIPLHELLAKQKAIPTDDMVSADIMVVRNPVRVPALVEFVATLTGARVTTPKFVSNGNGLSIKYKSCMRQHRALWVSPKFARSHPNAMKVLRTAMLKLRTWRVLRTKADFLRVTLHQLGKPRRKQQLFRNIALVTKSEKRSATFAHIRGALDAHAWNSYFRLGSAAEGMGMCGM